jgi:hypothetical protein
VREFELMLALRPGRPAVVAEGDSWFAYPSRNLLGASSRSNIVNRLSRAARLNLLQLASNGDEAVQMLSGSSKHRLIGILSRFPVDILLFSGGGNDIVGEHDFGYLLRNGTQIRSDDPRDYLQKGRLERRLSMIEMVYRELVEYCDEYSRNPGIHVVTHCYDYAPPSPRGATFVGGLVRPQGGRSWMHPALTGRHIPERHHCAIARHLIDGLAERLLRLQSERPGRFQVVDTRGTLEAQHWANEIHPNYEGFDRVAAAILSRLREIDPRFPPAS